MMMELPQHQIFAFWFHSVTVSQGEMDGIQGVARKMIKKNVPANSGKIQNTTHLRKKSSVAEYQYYKNGSTLAM